VDDCGEEASGNKGEGNYGRAFFHGIELLGIGEGSAYFR
jgi:hypothetical protein